MPRRACETAADEAAVAKFLETDKRARKLCKKGDRLRAKAREAKALADGVQDSISDLVREFMTANGIGREVETEFEREARVETIRRQARDLPRHLSKQARRAGFSRRGAMHFRARQREG